MSNAEQQARELAEKCAKEISTCPETIVVLTRVILRELNLVELLEDKARLDYLESKFPIPSEFKVAWIRTNLGKGNNSVRTAITNAMKEETK